MVLPDDMDSAALLGTSGAIVGFFLGTALVCATGGLAVIGAPLATACVAGGTVVGTAKGISDGFAHDEWVNNPNNRSEVRDWERRVKYDMVYT